MHAPPTAGVWAAGLLVGLLAALPAAWCQTTEASVKAAYTLNFAKFTYWPSSAEPEGAGLRVCVVGRSAVGEFLRESEGESVGARRLSVDQVRLPGDVSGCHLLYISELDLAREKRVLATLSGLPILTVSDLEGFAGAGGMVELVLVDRRLRFEINLDAVRRAGLRIDPNLLRLAVRVHGDKKSGE